MYLEQTFRDKNEKTMVNRITTWSSIRQLPQPTMVGQDNLKVPTLSINNFVNQAEIEGLEDSRVFWVLQIYLQKM